MLEQYLPTILVAVFAVAPAFLTELLTKASAPQAVKSFVNVVLAAGAATAAQFVLEPEWDWKQALVKFGVAWGVSLMAHYSGVTKPLQNATGKVGIGPRAYANEPVDHDHVPHDGGEVEVPGDGVVTARPVE